MTGTPLPPLGRLPDWPRTELLYLRRLRRLMDSWVLNPEVAKLDAIRETLGDLHRVEQTFRQVAL